MGGQITVDHYDHIVKSVTGTSKNLIYKNKQLNSLKWALLFFDKQRSKEKDNESLNKDYDRIKYESKLSYFWLTMAANDFTYQMYLQILDELNYKGDVLFSIKYFNL